MVAWAWVRAGRGALFRYGAVNMERGLEIEFGIPTAGSVSRG